MKEIQTWHERAMAHPDHQSGMVSEDMIRARMCEEIADLRAEVERLRVQNKRLRERLLQEQAALVLDEIGAALKRERVMRSALTDMLSGWRYIRDTYGDLAGVGWDRVEQKACNALGGQAMTDDRIAEIRARHAAPGVMLPMEALGKAIADRAFLLAEVERLSKAHEAACEGEELLRAAFIRQLDRLTQERDEARAALKPFSEFYLWPDDAGEWTANDVRSDEDWDEERNDAKTDDVFITRGQIRAARKALGAKP